MTSFLTHLKQGWFRKLVFIWVLTFPDLPKNVEGSVTTYTKELNTLKVTVEIMLIFKINTYLHPVFYDKILNYTGSVSE